MAHGRLLAVIGLACFGLLLPGIRLLGTVARLLLPGVWLLCAVVGLLLPGIRLLRAVVGLLLPVVRLTAVRPVPVADRLVMIGPGLVVADLLRLFADDDRRQLVAPQIMMADVDHLDIGLDAAQDQNVAGKEVGVDLPDTPAVIEYQPGAHGGTRGRRTVEIQQPVYVGHLKVGRTTAAGVDGNDAGLAVSDEELHRPEGSRDASDAHLPALQPHAHQVAVISVAGVERLDPCPVAGFLFFAPLAQLFQFELSYNFV